MRKEQRVKKNEEFQDIFKKERHLPIGSSFCIFEKGWASAIPDRDLGEQENRQCRMPESIKRYVRQSFLELREEVKDQYDYLIIARKPAADMNFHEVKSSLTHVLNRGKVLKRGSYGKNVRKKS